MADPAFRDAVVVGAFQTPYSKHPVKEVLDLLVDAVVGMLRRHEIRLEDLDGLAATSFQLAPDNVVTLAERLGASPAWAWQGAHGGASGVMGVLEAARAITDGRASTVIAVAGDSFDVSRHMQLMDEFNTGMRDYLAPYGFGGTNGLFALVEREHRELYGTKRTQLAKLATTQRANARLNPNALLRSPMSEEDYLTARLIADPVRLYDCVLPCTGADAVLLMSRERAAARGLPGITILSGRSQNNYLPLEPMSTRTGAERFAADLFSEAEVTHADLDFVQLYDDYPIMEIIQLEDLGFAKKGEGGAFVEATDISRTGTLAVNTGGGQLSCGQSGAGGGLIGMVEAVLQLLGQAGDRQLDSPRLGLVSGFGMVGYGKGLSSAATILRREGR
jgi:acetyl-CoA acetyltransferase